MPTTWRKGAGQHSSRRYLSVSIDQKHLRPSSGQRSTNGDQSLLYSRRQSSANLGSSLGLIGPTDAVSDFTHPSPSTSSTGKQIFKINQSPGLGRPATTHPSFAEPQRSLVRTPKADCHVRPPDRNPVPGLAYPIINLLSHTLSRRKTRGAKRSVRTTQKRPLGFTSVLLMF